MQSSGRRKRVDFPFDVSCSKLYNTESLYFHLQTSAIERKYPPLIVCIFLFHTHSISRFIYIQTLCVHQWNALRFLWHGTYHVVARGGSHFCQPPKSGGSGLFFIKTQGRTNTFLGKIPKFRSPPLPSRNIVPSLSCGCSSKDWTSPWTPPQCSR